MDMDKPEIIKKQMRIVFDGKQHLVRFPTEVTEIIDLGKYNVEFKIEVPEKGAITGELLKMRLVMKDGK